MGEPRPGGIRIGTIERRTPEQARHELDRRIMEAGGVHFSPTETERGQHTAANPFGDSAQEAVLLKPQVDLVGLDFDPAHGGKKLRNAELRGELSRSTIPTGKIEITQSTDPNYNQQQYEMDLSDAPASLQAGVDAAWATLQQNLMIFADHPKDTPAELLRQKALLEPIMALRIKDEPAPADEPEPVVNLPVRTADNAKRERPAPAADEVIFAAYRRKGWNNLGKRQRAHYRELKIRLEAAAQKDAA